MATVTAAEPQGKTRISEPAPVADSDVTPDEVFLPLRQGMHKSWPGLHRGMGRPAAGGSQLPFRMSSDENLEQPSIGNSR